MQRHYILILTLRIMMRVKILLKDYFTFLEIGTLKDYFTFLEIGTQIANVQMINKLNTHIFF